MKRLHAFVYRVAGLFRKKPREAEMSEEMRLHLDALTERHVAKGLSPEEARLAALRQFGNLGSLQEKCRDERKWTWMDDLVRDAAFALRTLSKNLGYATIAVFTLALGIGACTAIFSVVSTVLLRALPYDQPDQLVQLWEDPSGKGRDRNSVAGAQFADWKQQSVTMENLSAIRRITANLTGEGVPEQVSITLVSANYLQILRIQTCLGRGFLPDEDQAGKDKAVILSYRFWQRYFGGAAELIGRSIRLDNQSCTVIGVLPEKPLLPFEGDMLMPFVHGSEGWHRSRSDHRLRVIGRLKPDVSIEAARAEMAAITEGIRPKYPSWKKNWGVTVVPMHEELTGAIRPQLWVLFGAVAFVLLIACANVAGLLLARMPARGKELALRAALGADRWRVMRQLLTESVILSLMGGVLGILMAFWGVDLFKQLLGDNLPRAMEVAVDSRALGFAVFVSLATGILFGLAPYLHIRRLDVNEVLKKEGRAFSGASISGLRGALVVAEVALAMMLLVGSGLLMQTLLRLQAVPSGFNPRGALAMNMSLDDTKYPAGDKRAAFIRQVISRIESMPGVEAAGSATTLPMSGTTDTAVRQERNPERDEFYHSSNFDFVSGGFFQAMGIPIAKGRTFGERDDSRNAPRTAVMSESLAATVFPNENPLGQRVRVWGESWEIVGIAGDVRHRGLDRRIQGHIYLPQAFGGYGAVLVVRTKLPPLSLAESIRKEILKLDPNQPVARIRTLEQVVANASAHRRLMFILLSLFAVSAVLLSAIGLYGVMAYSVSQRTREIGIRMALGAQRGDVLSQIMRQGFKLTLLGVLAGLVGSLALTGVLSHLLFETTPRDPTTMAGVALLLAAVAMFACGLPAWRATRVDPVEALRAD